MINLMIRELKVLVGKVNELRKSETSRGGYFCYLVKRTPEMVVKIGEVGDKAEDYYHMASKLAYAKAGNPDLSIREAMGDSLTASNGHVIAFAGYPAEWDMAILFALEVELGWMKKDQALAEAPVGAKLNLAALLGE
ncbi:MAG: hypothetical protein PHC70_04150 [Patescibacteria group bacterium]|nr:hypothetical protein [Patescibacteria group bacterium]